MRLKRHHYGILGITLLLLGALVGYSIFKNNIVPIAWVNGEVIFLHEVQENARISQRLYAQAPQLVEGNEGLATVLAEGDEQELFARAFESSIVNAIIRSNISTTLAKEARSSSYSALSGVEEELFNDLLESQYEWDVDRFRERIVEPQLIQELLIKEHGESYASWLLRAKKEATVRVWFVPFDWEGEELVKK